MKHVCSLLVASLAIVGCSSSSTGGSGGAFAVPVATVPACTLGDLSPFAAVGTGYQFTQLPVGQYNYTGGETYIETLNLSPNMAMHLQDNQPNAQSYSGNLLCLTNGTAPIRLFNTGGYLFKFMNITGTQFNLAIDRTLSIVSDGTNITNTFTSDDTTLTMTNAEVAAKQMALAAHGDSLNVYQTGVNTYRAILIRVSTGQGITSRFYIRADYTKTL